MPSFIRRESFSSQAYLCGHAEFEFVVGHFQESKELSYHDLNIALVDKGVRELQCSATDGDVPVPQAVQDNIAMSLDSISVHRYNLIQGV